MSQLTHESPAESLARSAFGFAFLLLIPAIITWMWLLLSPESPSPLFRQIRLAIIGGGAVGVLLLVGLCVYFFRTKPESLLKPSERLVRLLQVRWVALWLLVLLLELNILAFLLLRNVAPAITSPAKFLLVCWSLIVVGIVWLINRDGIAHWFTRTQSLWVGIGMSVLALVIFVGVWMLNSWLVNLSGVDDRLRGSLDYRELIFYDDGQPAPSPQAFWQEQSQTQIRWSPYTYWMVDEFNGDYINIGANGLRYTPDYSDGDAQRIYVFGGSTVWGEGARDSYTIPGHIARLLNESDTPQTVVNYGQTGYVSTQDLLMFQLQLLAGDVPDIAIFYQGFNDVLSGWDSTFHEPMVGLTLQENFRLSAFEAGRRLGNGQPVLLQPSPTLDDYDLSEAGVVPTSPEAIANRWFANVDMVRQLAEAYGVQVLFVWQPAIIYKDTLTNTEQAIYERWEAERAGLFALYAEVDSIVRARVEQENLSDIIVLSDLFVGNEQTIFHDLVHITEVGNAFVAEAMMPRIIELLNQQ